MTSIVLQITPEFQNRGVMQPEFGSQRFRRFAFHDTTKQENHLLRCQMTLLKDGARVQVVWLPTLVAPVDGEVAAVGGTKHMRLRNGCSTTRAFQAIRMEMLQSPLLTLRLA